jgi:SAM-dependent methyltransferase
MQTQALKTWAATRDEEDAMNDDHYPLWQQMIGHVREQDLTSCRVLDYGCNQGGFLRLLYRRKSFRRGVGVDLAELSLEVACRQLRNEPVEFHPVSWLSQDQDKFDMAFSHEVLYLLPDLAAHAALMSHALNPGGVYYAAIGCHTDNPQWARWKDLIGSYSNIPVQDYSLDDYANAFFDAGFTVGAMPYSFEGFVPLKKDNSYFPKVRDSLDYYRTHKTLFRFQKKAA